MRREKYLRRLGRNIRESASLPPARRSPLGGRRNENRRPADRSIGMPKSDPRASATGPHPRAAVPSREPGLTTGATKPAAGLAWDRPFPEARPHDLIIGR